MVTVGWFSFHLNSRWNCKSAFLCLPWKYWFALMATLHFCHIVSHMHQRQHLECCFSEGGICSKARVEQNFSHLIPAWQYITLFPPSPGKWRMQFGHQWSKWIGKSNSRLISRHVTHLKSSSCNFLAPPLPPNLIYTIWNLGAWATKLGQIYGIGNKNILSLGPFVTICGHPPFRSHQNQSNHVWLQCSSGNTIRLEKMQRPIKECDRKNNDALLLCNS